MLYVGTVLYLLALAHGVQVKWKRFCVVAFCCNYVLFGFCRLCMALASGPVNGAVVEVIG